MKFTQSSRVMTVSAASDTVSTALQLLETFKAHRYQCHTRTDEGRRGRICENDQHPAPFINKRDLHYEWTSEAVTILGGKMRVVPCICGQKIQSSFTDINSQNVPAWSGTLKLYLGVFDEWRKRQADVTHRKLSPEAMGHCVTNAGP